jgi:flavin-dependent dehydrogenase
MFKVAVVGSGPSGLFLCKNLLKSFPNTVKIDIFEKLSEPFGLLRFGVAPDHSEVKVKSHILYYIIILRKNLFDILVQYLNQKMYKYILMQI